MPLNVSTASCVELCGLKPNCGHFDTAWPSNHTSARAKMTRSNSFPMTSVKDMARYESPESIGPLPLYKTKSSATFHSDGTSDVSRHLSPNRKNFNVVVSFVI
jgi:hypothetical protein